MKTSLLLVPVLLLSGCAYNERELAYERAHPGYREARLAQMYSDGAAFQAGVLNAATVYRLTQPTPSPAPVNTTCMRAGAFYNCTTQ